MIRIENYKWGDTYLWRIFSPDGVMSVVFQTEQEALEWAYDSNWLKRPVPQEPWVWKPAVVKTTKDLEIEIYE